MGKKTTTYKSVVSVNCHPPDGQKSNPSTARDLGAKMCMAIYKYCQQRYETQLQVFYVFMVTL